MFKEDLLIGGCIDNWVLNYDFMVEESDGSCEYFSVIFYVRFLVFNGI